MFYIKKEENYYEISKTLELAKIYLSNEIFSAFTTYIGLKSEFEMRIYRKRQEMFFFFRTSYHLRQEINVRNAIEF